MYVSKVVYVSKVRFLEVEQRYTHKYHEQAVDTKTRDGTILEEPDLGQDDV